MVKQKVFDYTKYRKFDYQSEKTNVINLGDVVTKVDDDGTDIGIVIQTFKDGDFRTDMFGMASISEVRFSTKTEIKKYRPTIILDLLT